MHDTQCVCVVCVYVCDHIYKNIYSLLSFSDQTVVSTTRKAKLHQHQRFCIKSSSWEKPNVLHSKAKYYDENKIL